MDRDEGRQREVPTLGNKTREFLDSHDVKYITISHSPAFTAQEIAASAHIPGRELANTVTVKIDGEMAMAVLASENEFSELFPECEVGAMPPSAISITCPSTWQIRWQTMLRSPSTPATAAS